VVGAKGGAYDDEVRGTVTSRRPGLDRSIHPAIDQRPRGVEGSLRIREGHSRRGKR
jgi:hypothetical protein